MVNFTVVPERMALVNIDIQNLFVEGTPTGHATLGRINRLAAACREAGILVIHTSHVLRPDGSNMGVLGEVAPPVKDGLLNKGAETAALHKELVALGLSAPAHPNITVLIEGVWELQEQLLQS